MKARGYAAAGMFFSALRMVGGIFSSNPTIPDVKIPGVKKDAVEMREMLLKPKTFLLTNSKAKDLKEDVKEGTQADKKPIPCSIQMRIIFGCAGKGPDSPAMDVAGMLDQLLLELEKNQDISTINIHMVILGDTFYPGGVLSPAAKEFLTHFYQIYQNEKYTALRKIKVFLNLGNHCLNLSFSGFRAGGIDLSRMYAQVAHTYLNCETPEMYLADELDISKLPTWNMPRPCYVNVTVGDEKKEENTLVEMYINWSTIVRDYLNSLGEEKDNPDNQANYLRAEFLRLKKIHGDRLMTVMYSHGPRSVHDKGYTEDASIKYSLYLTSAEVEKLKELKFAGKNYNEVFDEVLDRLGIEADAVYAADTHATYNFLSPADKLGRRKYNVGIVGGNDKLEAKCDLDHQKELRYMQENGCVIATFDLRDKSKRILNKFYLQTTPVQHYQFDQFSEFPIVSATNDERVKLLRELVRSCYKKYFDGLGKNALHGSEGIRDADDLFNVFHQFEELKFAEAVEYLQNFYNKKRYNFSRIGKGSMLSYIEDEMKERLKVTDLAKFFEKPAEAFLPLQQREPVASKFLIDRARMSLSSVILESKKDGKAKPTDVVKEGGPGPEEQVMSSTPPHVTLNVSGDDFVEVIQNAVMDVEERPVLSINFTSS